ncbi:TPA: hypothetical protein ACQTXQ_005761 [Pseudomonas aeruginosa]
MNVSALLKVYKPADAVKFRVTNERRSGVNRVRIEGEVFGAKASTVKHFGSPAEADAFFDAMTEADAEAWWQSLQDRAQQQLFGLAEQELLYGAGECFPRGLLHA